MEKIINISGKEVKMAATAGTLIRYQTQFGRDLLGDLKGLENKFEKIKTGKEDEFSVINLQMFSELAWTLAKTADKTIPPMEEWLDQFDMFGIYEVLPQIFELLSSNFGKGNQEQKKAIAPMEVRQEN